ncbi:MAG: hypothetical protein R3A50_07065 [Saprospiraceae bacterium]
MDIGTIVNFVGVIVTSIGLIITIILFFIQQKKTWLLNSAIMTTNFVDKFNDSEFRKIRREFATESIKIINNEQANMASAVQILGFYENIGYLTRRGVLDKEMIWNKFSWTAIRYFFLLDNKAGFLKYLRIKEQDNLLYSEFSWLSKEMIIISQKKGNDNYATSNWTDEVINTRISELIEQEKNLL